MARLPAAETRAHILDIAAELFDAHGVHAVGLQQIIDRYGCGKNLLYREFPSKDDLVVAYLERSKLSWHDTVSSAAREHPDDAAGQLVAIIRLTMEKSTENGCRGCPLRNALAEFPEPEHPAHRVAADYFDGVHRLMNDLAKRTGAADPATLADRMVLILDGVYTNGATLGPTGAAPAAVAFAEDIIAMAVR
jgi:AcrR family transcriptional regulator